MCTICASKVSGQKCTWSDPYAGDEGAFKCLIESGDIAFLRHTIVLEMVKDQSLFSKIYVSINFKHKLKLFNIQH